MGMEWELQMMGQVIFRALMKTSATSGIGSMAWELPASWLVQMLTEVTWEGPLQSTDGHEGRLRRSQAQAPKRGRNSVGWWQMPSNHHILFPQPFSYNAATQLLEGGSFGEVPLCQTWHWVPVQAVAHRLCGHSAVCINLLHSLSEGVSDITERTGGEGQPAWITEVLRRAIDSMDVCSRERGVFVKMSLNCHSFFLFFFLSSPSCPPDISSSIEKSCGSLLPFLLILINLFALAFQSLSGIAPVVWFFFIFPRSRGLHCLASEDLWATQCSWRCPCLLQEGWTRWLSKVSSNPNHSVIQWSPSLNL